MEKYPIFMYIYIYIYIAKCLYLYSNICEFITKIKQVYTYNAGKIHFWSFCMIFFKVIYIIQ